MPSSENRCEACGESSLTHDVERCVPVKGPGASSQDIHQRRCPYSMEGPAAVCRWCAGHQDAYDQMTMVKANPEKLTVEDLLHERQTVTEMLWRALVWEQSGAVPGKQLARAAHALIEENERNQKRAGKAEEEVRRVRSLVHEFNGSLEDLLRYLPRA